MTSGTYQQYLAAVKRYDVLSREEEVATFQLWKDTGDRVHFDKIITSNLRFAIKKAQEFSKRYNMPLNDLVQVANIGLMRAAERFDHTRGVRFISYADLWLKDRMQMHTRDTITNVNIPTQVARRCFFSSTRAAWTKKDKDDYNNVLSLRFPVRINHVSRNDDRQAEETLIGLGKSSIVESIQRAANDKTVHSALRQLRKTLNPIEKEILTYRLMRDGKSRRLLKDVAKKHSISPQRASQVEKRLRQKIRSFFVETIDDVQMMVI